MNQTWENGKKPSFGNDFGTFGPNLSLQIFFSWILPLQDMTNCFSLLLYAFSRKLMSQTWKNGKNLVLGPISAHLAQIRTTKFSFFKKIWLRQSLDIMVSYHHVQYQKKLMIEPWENLVTDRQTDRPTDRRTDGQTDDSDFIGRCPTNAKRPHVINDSNSN